MCSNAVRGHLRQICEPERYKSLSSTQFLTPLTFFKSPVNLNTRLFIGDNDSPSVALNPEWIEYRSNKPRLLNVNEKTAQEAY